MASSPSPVSKRCLPPACGMRQQMKDGYPFGDAFVLQLQIGQVSPDRGVQVDFPRGDQLHGRGGGVGLADRADLEAGFRGDLLLRFEVGHSENGMLFFAVHQDAERRSRNAVRCHRLFHGVSDGAESR